MNIPSSYLIAQQLPSVNPPSFPTPGPGEAGWRHIFRVRHHHQQAVKPVTEAALLGARVIEHGLSPDLIFSAMEPTVFHPGACPRWVHMNGYPPFSGNTAQQRQEIEAVQEAL